MSGSVDPVLARRAQVAGWVSKGIRLGSALYVIASVVFFVGIMTGFTDVMVTMIVALLIVGSALLAPSIVFKYAVNAADRADRDDSW